MKRGEEEGIKGQTIANVRQPQLLKHRERGAGGWKVLDVKLDVQTSESNKEPGFGASAQTHNNRKTNKTNKNEKKNG